MAGHSPAGDDSTEPTAVAAYDVAPELFPTTSADRTDDATPTDTATPTDAPRHT